MARIDGLPHQCEINTPAHGQKYSGSMLWPKTTARGSCVAIYASDAVTICSASSMTRSRCSRPLKLSAYTL